MADTVTIKEKEFYNLADLLSVRTWNYEKPTLVTEGRFTNRNAWQESSTFWNKFVESYPIFKTVSLDGLAIIGGAIVDLLLGRNPNDIDLIFFSDGTAEEQGVALRERVTKLVGDIYKHTKEHNETLRRKKDQGIPVNGTTDTYVYAETNIENLLVKRYKNMYEINVPDTNQCSVPIQISHCSDLKTLLAEVDISCSAVAYYNGEIHMPKSAKEALESLAFVVNTEDKSARYLTRVKKYFDKGFDIILPELDMAKLHRRNLKFDREEVLDMPYFEVVYDGIKANKIMVCDTSVTEKASAEVLTLPGYDGSHSLSVGELIHQNIRNLVHRKFDEFTFIGQGETYRQAFQPDILITERMLTNTYETVSKSLFAGQALNLGKIEQFFTCRQIKDVMKGLIVEFADKVEDGKDIYVSKKFDEHVKDYLEKLTEEQIMEAKNVIVSLKGKGSLAINYRRDEAQPCSKEEWYGEYGIATVT